MRAQADDEFVLLGDGVYAATAGLSLKAKVLAEDLQVRGVRARADMDLIEYPALVELCAQHHPVVSWND